MNPPKLPLRWVVALAVVTFAWFAFVLYVTPGRAGQPSTWRPVPSTLFRAIDPTPPPVPISIAPPVLTPVATPIPTARPQSVHVHGIASWYAYRTGEAAAGPALRVGAWRGRIVTVTSAQGSVTVRLTDSCDCYDTRLIDLDVRDFARLADPGVGLLRDVRVSWALKSPLP